MYAKALKRLKHLLFKSTVETRNNESKAESKSEAQGWNFEAALAVPGRHHMKQKHKQAQFKAIH